MTGQGGHRVRAGRRVARGRLRELSAVLASGLVVLTAVLFTAWGVAIVDGDPGPGTAMLAGHLVGAVVAVGGYRRSRLRADSVGRLAGCAPVVVLLLLGILFWWG